MMKNLKPKSSKMSMKTSDQTITNTWKIGLKNTKSIPKTFRSVELGLRSALQSLQELKENEESISSKIDNSKNFNEIIKFCLSHVSPALFKLYKMNSHSDKPVKNPQLASLKHVMRNYLKSLILLSRSMTDPSASEVIISRGILPMIPFYCQHSKISIALVKHLAQIWCTSQEERVQVLAFIAIFRLTRSSSNEVLEHILKLLYASYASNSKFTSPASFETINFMRKSLVELYCLNQPMAYKLAFTYIRNMANHLRNAMITPKMEKIQLVYNWPFIHSLHFIGELLAMTHPSPILKPLIYPWTQIALGTMGLQKSPKYFPLVFNLSKILTEFSYSTSTFIPVLTPLLEALHYKELRFIRKTLQNDMQEEQFRWNCILKVSAFQMKNNSFTDGIIDQLYDCILSYLSMESASIGFPELAFPVSLQIKTFTKNSKCPSYVKKMSQLLDKIQENSSFITERRREVTFGVADTKAVKDWEIATKQSGPPLLAFYNNWKKIKDRKDSHSNSRSDKKEISHPEPKRNHTKEEENLSYEEEEEENDDDNPQNLCYDGPEDILGEYMPSEDEQDIEEATNMSDEDMDDSEEENKNLKEIKQPKQKHSRFGKRPRKSMEAEDKGPLHKKRRMKNVKKFNIKKQNLKKVKKAY